ncbi:hypothetical protein D3C71_1730150 [compost metagenome]
MGLEGNELDSEFLGHLLVIIGSLNAADRLTLQFLPFAGGRFFSHHDRRAWRRYVSGGEIDDLVALRRDAKRRENRIDTTSGQELDTIGGNDRHKFDLV